MALVILDRVKETCVTTGTGAVTLQGAVSGYQAFSVIGNGNTTYYAIVSRVAFEWEVGVGTYTSATLTLSRDTVLSSSNSGSLVNFSAGTKDVLCTYPAERAVTLSSDGTTLPVNGNLTFSGAGQRIYGDFSNATISNRTLFQTTTANSYTDVWAVPTGSGSPGAFTAAGGSDPNNANTLSLQSYNDNGHYITGGRTGTTRIQFLPIYFLGHPGYPPAFQVTPSSGYTNNSWWNVLGSTAGNDVILTPNSATVSPVSARISSRGVGNLHLCSADGVSIEASVVGNPSGSSRWITLTGGTASVNPTISTSGGALTLGSAAGFINVNPSTAFAAAADMYSGNGVSTGDVRFEMGGYRTGSGNVYIDFHATSGTDYECRLLRLGGADGVFSFANKGLGLLKFQQENAAPITFETSLIERMRISAAGNVGIGGAPSDPATYRFLEIYGDAGVGGGGIRAFSGTGTAGVDLRVQAQGSIGYVGSYTTAPVVFIQNGVERFRIDGTAINVTNQNYTQNKTDGTSLLVEYTSIAASGYAPPILSLNRWGASSTATPDNSTAGQIRFNGLNTSNGYANLGTIGVDTAVNTTNGPPADMFFYTASGTASGSTERMRITSAGAVTLGGPYSAPSLKVNQVAGSTRWVEISGSNGVDPIISTSGGALTLSSSTANVNIASGAVFNAAQNIASGTGVSTGDVVFEHGNNRTGDGNVYIDMHATAASDYETRIIRAGGANGAFTIANNGTGTFSLTTVGAGAMVFSTSNTERGRFAAAGRFETIGDSNGQAVVIRARAADDFGQMVFTNNAGNTGRLFMSVDSSNNTTYSSGSSAVNQFSIAHTASSTRYLTVTGSNGGNPKIYTSAGNLTLGNANSSMATNATEGHIMIPSCAGTPTGAVSGAGLGQIPMVYDSNANKIWFLNGGTWRGVVVT